MLTQQPRGRHLLRSPTVNQGEACMLQQAGHSMAGSVNVVSKWPHKDDPDAAVDELAAVKIDLPMALSLQNVT